MRIQSVKNIFTQAFSQPERHTVYMLSGAPGVGKTAIVAQVAEELGMPLVNIALPTCESIDLRGLPFNDNGIMKWASPLPKAGRGILLLDELSSAPLDVQVAAHHIVWAEKGSDMSLPLGWHVVLTGNRATDHTQYTGLSAPLRNRITMIDVEVGVNEWKEWAELNGINPGITGFVHWRPELLFTNEVPETGAFVSPRAWERLNSILDFKCSALEEQELIAGTIGKGAAKEFVEYLATYRHLPNIDSIMADPLHAKIPDQPALLYALTSQLATWTVDKQLSAMEYVQRIKAEYALLYIKRIAKKFPLDTDPIIRKWIADHQANF